MLERGQELVLWQDGDGTLHVMHRAKTLRAAKAWCRANGEAFAAAMDDEELHGEAVVLVEVKAVTRPRVARVVSVDFDDGVEADVPVADDGPQGDGGA